MTISFTGSSFFLFYLLQARDMKVIGDLQKAKEYSTWALGLNVAALIIIILISIGLVIFYTALFASYNSERNRHYG